MVAIGLLIGSLDTYGTSWDQAIIEVFATSNNSIAAQTGCVYDVEILLAKANGAFTTVKMANNGNYNGRVYARHSGFSKAPFQFRVNQPNLYALFVL